MNNTKRNLKVEVKPLFRTKQRQAAGLSTTHPTTTTIGTFTTATGNHPVPVQTGNKLVR